MFEIPLLSGRYNYIAIVFYFIHDITWNIIPQLALTSYPCQKPFFTKKNHHHVAFLELRESHMFLGLALYSTLYPSKHLFTWNCIAWRSSTRFYIATLFPSAFKRHSFSLIIWHTNCLCRTWGHHPHNITFASTLHSFSSSSFFEY